MSKKAGGEFDSIREEGRGVRGRKETQTYAHHLPSQVGAVAIVMMKLMITRMNISEGDDEEDDGDKR